MKLEDFQQTWHEYGVEIQGKIIPLKERYVICWGKEKGGLIFDTGGEIGESHILTVNGMDLISINPDNPKETTRLGKLEKLSGEVTD